MRVNLFRWAFVSGILLATLYLSGCSQPSPETTAPAPKVQEPQAQKPEVREPLGYITILTYNTHLFIQSRGVIGGLAKGKVLVKDDNLRQKEIQAQIKNLNADIVALQEVWAPPRQKRIWETLKNPYQYPFAAPQSEDVIDLGKSGFKNTCGLVLLSKYRWLERDFREYDRSMFSDKDEEYYARKGIITETVAPWPGGPTIRIGISHTRTGEELNDVKLIAEETLKRKKDGGVIDSPAIMMGDFNVHYDKYGAMKKIFDKYGAVDAYRELHPCSGEDEQEHRCSENDYTIDRDRNPLHQIFFEPTTKKPEYDRDRLDYVFVKKSGGGLELKPVEATVIRNWKYGVWKPGSAIGLRPKQLRDLSDHYPVKVRFEVTRIVPAR